MFPGITYREINAVLFVGIFALQEEWEGEDYAKGWDKEAVHARQGLNPRCPDQKQKQA